MTATTEGATDVDPDKLKNVFNAVQALKLLGVAEDRLHDDGVFGTDTIEE